MTKHELVHAAPIMLERVLGNDFRTTEAKIDFVDFLQASLDRAADSIDPLTDADLCLPMADLFGLMYATRRVLEDELYEEE